MVETGQAGRQTGQQVGYMRVSSRDQNESRQLSDIPLDKTFTDKTSGASLDRPELQVCLDYLRDGDTLHVHSMDRLARNLIDLQQTVDKLTSKGVTVHFHKEALVFNGNTESSISKLMLQIMGAVAEFERSLIKERQREGIRQYKKKGGKFGRKPTIQKDEADEIIRLLKDGMTKAAIAAKLGVSRQTLYRSIKAHGIITKEVIHGTGQEVDQVKCPDAP